MDWICMMLRQLSRLVIITTEQEEYYETSSHIVVTSAPALSMSSIFSERGFKGQVQG